MEVEVALLGLRVGGVRARVSRGSVPRGAREGLMEVWWASVVATLDTGVEEKVAREVLGWSS
jgi:hypothetical protein